MAGRKYFSGMNQQRIRLFDVPVDVTTLPDLLQEVESILLLKQRSKIMYLNINCMNYAYNNPRYRKTLNEADVVYCDGAGIVLGARLMGIYLPGRMTGADWIYDLCELCERKGYSLFFLGGEPGIAEKAKEVLIKRFSKLLIIGTHHGYFTKNDNDILIFKINKLRPDILLVGLGTPLQEFWIDENFHKLNVPVVWAVGAVMDFVSGKLPRAPKWMLNNGLEWLFRLLIEPSRMWKRYIIGNPLFILRVLKERIRGMIYGDNSL